MISDFNHESRAPQLPWDSPHPSAAFASVAAAGPHSHRRLTHVIVSRCAPREARTLPLSARCIARHTPLSP